MGNLLREHTEMVAEVEHVLEDIDSSDEIFAIVDASTSEGFDQPEGTHAKGTLPTTDAYSDVRT
jgi:hypothetical protein